MHKACRTNLTARYSRCSKYEVVVENVTNYTAVSEANLQDPSSSEDPTYSKPCTRSELPSVNKKTTCFVCNIETERSRFQISKELVGEKQIAAQDKHFHNFNSPCHLASKRLMLNGSAVDMFAVDIYYHNLCLQNFNRVREKSSVSDPLHSMVMGHFNDYVNQR